jgi:small GTP-binding protein
MAPGPLGDALDELGALAGPQDRQLLDGLRTRLADQRLRVLVAGEAKRGKSTLVNALLGRPLLPTGVTPLTALATTVRHGRDESVTAVFPDRTERLPLAALDELVTERGNPGNAKSLSSVTVWADAPLLARGVELVDTPGTGSVFEHNTAQARAVLETLDAAVFVLTADPPVSASERDLIGRVAGLSAAMFVVLNKTDYLSPGELDEVLSFSAGVVAEAAGQPVRIYPVSARDQLTGSGDPGFAEFAAEFAAYLDRAGTTDLLRSVANQALRLAGALRDEIAVARRAAELLAGRSEERVQAFASRLSAAADQRRLAGDLAEAEERRMLAALNESARQAGRQRTAAVREQIAKLLAGDLGSARPAEVERTGHDRVAELAEAEAEAWRGQRAEVLETGLARLDDRLNAVLAAEVEGVRSAAAELLGLELAVPPAGRRLAPDRRFFYSGTGQAGQTELLAGAVRRRLPGETGRNRARAYLDREITALVPQQIGRARADLQYRLAEASRHLISEVQSRYDEAVLRLERALADAGDLRAATAGELAARDRELAERLAALDHVITLLGLPAGVT